MRIFRTFNVRNDTIIQNFFVALHPQNNKTVDFAIPALCFDNIIDTRSVMLNKPESKNEGLGFYKRLYQSESDHTELQTRRFQMQNPFQKTIGLKPSRTRDYLKIA